MKNTILLYIGTMLFVLTGCDKSLHGIPIDRLEDENIVSVGLNTDKVSNAPLRDVHLFWFDQTDKLYRHDYFPSMIELAKARFSIPTGNYTIIAVLNTGKELSLLTESHAELPDIYLTEFTTLFRAEESKYPELLTGTLRYVVKGGVELVYIDLEKKTEGIKESNVELHLSIPSPRLPDFVAVRSVGSPALRGVAQIFKKGTADLFTTKRAMLLPVSGKEGVYSMGLSLGKGDYDINLWVDYTTAPAMDHHYLTSGTDIVHILDKANYIANTDTRDAFSMRTSLSVTEGVNAPQTVEMHRPLAKYRLVATDVKKYEELRVRRGYPALEDLTIEIGYEGFLPNSYSISQKKPADAETGYKYTSAYSEQEETKVTVGKDYIFVNGTQSFVTVTILFKNSKGKTISGARGVKIAYRAGFLTTVSGEFLTAGLSGGITIDTDWSGSYDVGF
ncbi:MAG: hypothetical protein RRY07_10455 [Bacteroidaceae bacterium]